jgi:hypothetical protein
MAGEWSGLPPIVFGLLAGMDKHGELILGTYLYGGGKRIAIDERSTGDPPFWADYMMKHQSLKDQCLGQLIPAVREIAGKKQLGKFAVNLKFHAEFPENSGYSGYELLHGSNRDVGDFRIGGIAEVSHAIDPKEGDFDIKIELHYEFNDIVDPNHSYKMDTIREKLAKVVTFGQAKAYRLQINWHADLLIEVRQGRQTWYGYPSQNKNIPVRPLPRSTLDWVGSHQKAAATTERRIIEQLKRNIAPNDVKSLADRKQRLLWLFYGLAGYMAGPYLERLKVDSSSDEMARLMKQRISSQLRAECIEALKGKRPGGPEPTWPPAR